MSRGNERWRNLALSGLGAFATCAALSAQGSQHALRFHGTGTNQQDRVRIRIDDDATGPDASTACDIGAHSFTIELWLRGTLAANATTSSGGDASFPDARWSNANVIVDRSIAGGSGRTFGVGLAGGFVRFGTGPGDGPVLDAENTIEGNVNVLDGTWHHVAVVRDAHTGRKIVYVDGLVDFATPAGVSTADLSYPDAGASGQTTPWGPYLVLGAQKDDLGPNHPAFDGFVDEVRVWNIARRGSEINADMHRIEPPGTIGLVALYRLEEGAGTVVHDTSGAGSPDGELVAGVPGDGEWTSYATNAFDTAPITNAQLPAGFTRTIVASQLDEPDVIAFAPDGRLFVGERTGAIRIVDNGALLDAPLIQLQIDNQGGERGLSGLALDPSFAANGWIYVHYTTIAPRNRVSRFTVVGNSAALGSELVVWQSPSLAASFHHAGCVGFGGDGRLYVSTGDQFDSASSQLLSSVNGKILRMDPDGRVPGDNPFIGVPGARPEIWARGLRNPFRFTFDAAGGALWIADVGGNGSNAWEELERGVAGANYGWPDQEGQVCYSGTCGAITLPTFTYRHDDTNYVPGLAQAALIAGVVYRGTQFPPEYQGNLFLGDYANRWIRRLVLDAAGNVTGNFPFDPAPDAGAVTDMKVGPDGALYYVAYGFPSSGASENAKIWKIAYTGTTNAPPVVNASASPQSGLPPLLVQFQGSSSFDPDHGPGMLTFHWSFGDGATSVEADPQHVYASQGVFHASLALSDGASQTNSAPIDIAVGHPPAPLIRAPAGGALYRAGDVIAFAGGAKDVEDGVIPTSALTWRVVLVHLDHTHPFFGPVSGIASGTFTIPTTGHEPADTHYDITLDAIDSSGITGSRTISILPTTTPVSIDTQPTGIPVLVDGEPAATPDAFESLVGFHHTFEVPKTFSIGGASFDFVRWSTGTTTSILEWVAPAGGGSVRAMYTFSGSTPIVVEVAAQEQNAEHTPASGQEFANALDPDGLCFGRDAAGVHQVGLEFELPVPRGSEVLEAVLELTATADQAGAAIAVVHAYAVGSAPPFVQGSPTSLTSFAPLGAAYATWAPPLVPLGQRLQSPDLSAIVHGVVRRGDWSSGNVLGLVLDGSAGGWDTRRCLSNFASGNPPRLRVRFRPPADPNVEPAGH